jgi:hypothetical protein
MRISNQINISALSQPPSKQVGAQTMRTEKMCPMLTAVTCWAEKLRQEDNRKLGSGDNLK